MRSLILMLCVAITSCLLSLNSASAQQGKWHHNGSIMEIEQDGPHITFRYRFPRPGIQRAGATQGDVVLHANLKEDNTVTGYAYIFKLGCEPAEYSVRGSVNERGDYLEVHGAAPVFAQNSCSIIGYAWNHNSTLVFINR